jgi:autotransporter-associated beta strand protein
MGLTNGLVNGVLIGSSSTGNNATLDMTAAGNYVMNSYGASSATYGQSIVFTNSSGGAGNYTLTFTNANNYASGAAAAGRTLNNASANLTVAFTGAVDNGSSVNGDVIFTGPGGFTINGSLTNSTAGVRGLAKNGDGTLTLNAASGYNGTTTLTLGTIALGANGTLGTNSVTMSGGTLAVGTSSSTIKDLTVNGGVITGTGTLTSANSFTFANTTGTTEASAKLAGSGVLAKSGAGTTTLSGNNSYSGRTTVTAGTLTLSGNNSEASGGVTLTAGTLNVNSANALGSGTLILTAGTINNTSGAAVENSVNNAVTYSGTGLNFGTSASRSSNDLDLGAGTVTVTSSKSLNLLGAGTTLKMGTLENNSALTSRTFTFDGAGNTMLFRGFNIAMQTATATTNSLAGSANLTISGVIANGNLNANGVNIKGTGTTTFSGANTYTGGTEVFSGATLLYGANDVTADAGGQMAVSGTLDIASYNDTVSSVKVDNGGLLRGTTGVLTAGNFDITGANTVSANLGGSSATLAKGMSNTVSILSGNNTYGGLTLVSGGTLKLGSSTALGTTAGVTDVTSAGFLDLNGQTGVAEALNFSGTGGLLNSATGATATVSGAVDIGSGMTVETVGDITLSGQLTGSVSKNLTKTGAGILKVTAANSTFTGTNTVSAGTLLVDTGANVASSSSIVNGGLLKVNGTVGAVTVNINGSLGGSGTVGDLTVANGAFLTPGNSPGTLNATSASLLAGSTYNWEINNAAVTPGAAGTNWDLLNVTNELNLSTLTTLSGGQLNLVLKSLDLAGLGTTSLSGFTIDTAYSWVFAQAGEINNAAFTNGADVTDYFNINTTAFNNDALPAGYFKVQVGETITEGGSTLKTLQLMTIPEPSTGSMLGLGFAGLVVTRLLRRKIS